MVGAQLARRLEARGVICRQRGERAGSVVRCAGSSSAGLWAAGFGPRRTRSHIDSEMRGQRAIDDTAPAYMAGSMSSSAPRSGWPCLARSRRARRARGSALTSAYRSGPVHGRISAVDRPTSSRPALGAPGGPVHGRIAAVNRPTLPGRERTTSQRTEPHSPLALLAANGPHCAARPTLRAARQRPRGGANPTPTASPGARALPRDR